MFSIVFRMWNLVSEIWIGADRTVEWWNSIVDFAASPRWIPKGRSFYFFI